MINAHRPCWAPKGMRPKAPRRIVRAFVYVYTAVCMALGKISSLILPWANTEMTALFLEHVSKDFKDYFVIMLVDQAGWHTSKNLKIPENIGLLPQPSNSLELNPIEPVREHIREKVMDELPILEGHLLENALVFLVREGFPINKCLFFTGIEGNVNYR